MFHWTPFALFWILFKTRTPRLYNINAIYSTLRSVVAQMLGFVNITINCLDGQLYPVSNIDGQTNIALLINRWYIIIYLN